MSEQANINLRIDADGSKAHGELLKLAKSERDLEVAVKSGNRTTKIRANTEEELAKGLAKVEERERKAATAAQKRASVNLAAQKSAALLRDMEAKASRDKRTSMGFEAAAARAQLQIDERNHKRLVARQKEMARGYDNAALAASGFGEKASAAMTRAAAVAAPILGTMAALNKEFDVMIQRAQRGNQQAATMKDLVLALPEGAAGAKLKSEIISEGARYGLAPGQAAQTAMPLYATSDKDGNSTLDEGELASFRDRYKGASILQATGTATEDATNLQLAASNMGVGGESAAAKALKAAQMSMRGTDTIAKAAAPMSQFDDFDTGMGVITALSKGELNVGSIPDRVKDVQMALSSAADTDDFSKKHGLAGLSMNEKIAKLRGAAIQSGDVQGFTDRFRKDGLDEGKARAMALLIQQGDLYSSAVGEMKNVDPKSAGAAVTKLRNDALTKGSMMTGEAKAALEAHGMIGEGSDRAQDVHQKQIALGQELARYGGEQAVDPETGLPINIDLSSPRAALSSGYNRIMGTAKAGWNGMQILGRDSSGLGSADADKEWSKNNSELLEAIRENNKLLAENTAATEANSNASRGKSPVGGARSNAEEAN